MNLTRSAPAASAAFAAEAEDTPITSQDCMRVPVKLSLLCRTSSTSARLVGVMALRPEECTKLTGPSVAMTTFCFKSLTSEETLL
jgi:hypothetical protein